FVGSRRSSAPCCVPPTPRCLHSHLAPPTCNTIPPHRTPVRPALAAPLSLNRPIWLYYAQVAAIVRRAHAWLLCQPSDRRGRRRHETQADACTDPLSLTRTRSCCTSCSASRCPS